MTKPVEPLKIKVGQEITIRATRTGELTTGRFAGRTEVPGANGQWIKVNIAPKGKPSEYKLARERQVVR